jgi:hypothetical protein
VPPTWDITGHSVVQACKGKAGHTPRRVIVTARCRPVDRPDFPPVIFMNGHFPFRTPDRWADCQRNWRAHVEKVHDKGVTIITTRDVNFHEEELGPLPRLHADERQVFDDGIDRITIIEANPSASDLVEVRARRRPPVDLDIDGHNARVVELTLTA